MAFVKKTWEDRISQYPNRRVITDANGVSKPVTVARNEGEVTKEGDAFNAANMNDLENRIYNAIRQGGGGGASNLADLEDVDIDDETLATGQTLKYNGITEKWENGEGGASSADQVSFDDTDVAFSADDVQEAFENITKSLTWSEYQQLSSAEKNNGTIYFITDVNGDGQSFQPVIYSETEREIGVWTDGKPLYEKTFVRTTGITTGSYVINHDIDNFEKCVYQSGYIKTSVTYCPFTRVSSDNANIGVQGVSSTVINTFINSAFTNITEFAVTIRYTKTTDTAGSGTWTPQGVPAHHYSTDEQVVGTWIDGSTLYEKVIHSTTTPTGGEWNSMSIGSVNVLSYEAYFIRTTGAVDALYESYDGGLIGHVRPDTTGVKFEYKVPTAYVTNFQEVDVIVRYTKSSS